MAQTAKRLIDGAQMSGATTTYYTAPTATTTIIKKLLLVNTTVNAVACTVYLVPSAGTADAANTIFPGKSVPAGDTVIVWESDGLPLEPGGMIQAKGANVSILAGGIEIT